MPHVAGLRGVVAEQGTVAELVAKPLELSKALAAGSVAQDASRAVYRYHQMFSGGGRTFTRKSFACAIRLSDWADGEVRPHEDITPAIRDAHLARIRESGGYTEAVLCGVRDQAGEIERLFRGIEGGRPTLDVTTPDGVRHQLWRSTSAELIGKLRATFTPKKLHLLAGHDLYAAMLAYRDELAAKAPLAMYSSANYGLAYVVALDDAGLVSAPRHRVLTGSVTPSEVLAKARTHFIVEKLAGAANDVAALGSALANTVAHQPALLAVFAGDTDAYKLTLSPEVSPANEGVKTDRALAKHDPYVAEYLVVQRLFPALASTTVLDPTAALAALGAGASVVLIQRPLTLAQIIHVDELGHRLPPSSTAFYPPIAQGMVSMPVDPDSDVV